MITAPLDDLIARVEDDDDEEWSITNKGRSALAAIKAERRKKERAALAANDGDRE